MYTSCFFVCISFLRLFLSFSSLVIVRFLLLNRDAFFLLSQFSQISIASNRILYVALGLVFNHSATASIRVFSYLPFGVISFRWLLMSINYFLSVTVYCLVTIGKRGSDISWGSFFLISVLTQENIGLDDFVIWRYSFEIGVWFKVEKKVEVKVQNKNKFRFNERLGKQTLKKDR